MNLVDHVRELFEELKGIRASGDPFANGIPGIIDTGKGPLVTSPQVERKIAQIARVVMQNDPPVSRQFTHAEWVALVRKSFGVPLGRVDIDDNSIENCKSLLQEVRSQIDLARKEYGPKVYSIGCTLFSNTDVNPIVVGPVTIETREAWLKHSATEKLISRTTAKRIGKLWSGKLNRLSKRKKFVDQTIEKDIIDAIGAGPFVCRIETSGLASEAGKTKALMAGRLALTAISLLWERPSAALDGFRLKIDGDLRILKVLTQVPEKIILAGSKISHLPSGYTFQSGEWDQQEVRFKKLSGSVGEALEYYLHPVGDVKRPVLSNVLMQALLWFHEAARDTVDAMAVVKYVSSMDALACGNESRGILELLAARWGFVANKPLFKSGTETIKQAVERVYTDGRSRTVHGTNEKLTHDWLEMRNLAETLARFALVGGLIWANDNQNSDDPNQLRTK